LIRQVARVMVAFGCVILLASGCGQTIVQRDNAGPYSSAVNLFVSNCITCHGSNLQGGIGPNLQHVGTQLSRNALITRINQGGGPMPAYGPNGQGILTSAQITSLALWLSTLK